MLQSVGVTGTGKTHVAIALGVAACHTGQRVLFATATDWVARLQDAHQRGRLPAELTKLRRYGLIIIDEVQSTRGLLRLAQLAIRSSDKPVRQIKLSVRFAGSAFDTTGLGSYVTTTRARIRAAVQEFLHPSAPRASARRATPRRERLVPALDRGEALVRGTRTRPATRMPILVPARLTAKGRYPASTTLAPNPRRYVIWRRHAAYRLVIAEDASEGQFYGVQGTTWRQPPILAAAHKTRRIGGREYELYSDGGRLRLVAWRTPRAVYWVSNTLGLALNNEEMLGIARSATLVRAGKGA